MISSRYATQYLLSLSSSIEQFSQLHSTNLSYLHYYTYTPCHFQPAFRTSITSVTYCNYFLTSHFSQSHQCSKAASNHSIPFHTIPYIHPCIHSAILYYLYLPYLHTADVPLYYPSSPLQHYFSRIFRSEFNSYCVQALRTCSDCGPDSFLRVSPSLHPPPFSSFRYRSYVRSSRCKYYSKHVCAAAAA